MGDSAHLVAVTPTGGRYTFVPSCSCGWSWWGYLTEQAAQGVADDHKENADAEQASA